jgi:hypothetical protein
MKAAVLGLMGALAGASAAGPDRTGLYSNICYIIEGDDYGGEELQLRFANGHPVVVFKVCEGGCRTEQVSDVTLTGDRLSFKSAMDTVDLEGKPSGHDVRQITGKFSGRTLVLRDPQWPEPLHLVKQPQQAWPADGDWPAPVKNGCRN